MNQSKILTCVSVVLLFVHVNQSNGQQTQKFSRAMTEMNSGRHEPALKMFLEIEKSSSATRAERLTSANNAAWILARTSNRKIRNPGRAIRIIEPWVKNRGVNDWWVLDTLAMAYLGAGRQNEARQTINQAMRRVGSGSGNFAVNLQTITDHMNEINLANVRVGNQRVTNISDYLEKTWAEIAEKDPATANRLRLEHMNRRNKMMIDNMRILNDLAK